MSLRLVLEEAPFVMLGIAIDKEPIQTLLASCLGSLLLGQFPVIKTHMGIVSLN